MTYHDGWLWIAMGALIAMFAVVSAYGTLMARKRPRDPQRAGTRRGDRAELR